MQGMDESERIKISKYFIKCSITIHNTINFWFVLKKKKNKIVGK